MKVRVNPILCLAFKACENSVPEVLQNDEWGYAYVVPGMEEPPPDLQEKVRWAAGLCPYSAIIVEEDDQQAP